MAAGDELSPAAHTALRHLAGSIGVIALEPAAAGELVDAGLARRIGAGYAITVRGAATARPAEPPQGSSDEGEEGEERGDTDRLF